MSKWQVYISSTLKDLKDVRASLIEVFEKELSKNFELCRIMERMYDTGASTPFVEDTVQQVELSDLYILILGGSAGSYPPGESRTYTEIELDTAIEKKKRFFCFYQSPVSLNKKDKSKIAEILGKLDGKPKHAFLDFKDLLSKLALLLNPLASETPIRINNPFKGLSSFTTNDDGYFFGRSDDIEQCLKKIVGNREGFTVSVIGSSGVGKTSFVQAGLLSRLKAMPELGFADYLQIIITPGKEPFLNLRYQFQLNDLDTDTDNPEAFREKKVIIFLNQLEEIVTQCINENSTIERDRFLKFFDLIRKYPESFKNWLIITCFRVDFASQLANFDLVKQSQLFFPLSSLDYKLNFDKWDRTIDEIIRMPALRNGVEIQKELSTLIKEQIKDINGSLPILQFAMYQLWESDRKDNRQIQLEDYIRITGGRGIEGIIQTHADSVVNTILRKPEPTSREIILKSIFVNLVNVQEGNADIKRTVKKTELFAGLSKFPEQLVSEVFEYLIGENSRLLIISKALDGVINVDLIHEVLIRKWEKLKLWVNERRDALAYRELLLNDIKRFNADDKKLYRSDELHQLEVWRFKNPDLDNKSIERFSELSRNRIRKIRVTAAVILFLIAASVCLLKYFTTGHQVLFASNEYDFETNSADSTRLSKYVVLGDSLFYFDHSRDTLTLKYRPGQKDSIVKAFSHEPSWSGGQRFKNGNLALLDTSLRYFRSVELTSEGPVTRDSILLPDWMHNASHFPYFLTPKPNSYSQWFWVDQLTNGVFFVSSNGTLFLNRYDKNTHLEFRYKLDSLKQCEIFRVGKKYLLRFRGPGLDSMYGLNPDSGFFRIDDKIRILYNSGRLYYDETSSRMFFNDTIAKKIKVFDPFIPQKTTDLLLPKIILPGSTDDYSYSLLEPAASISTYSSIPIYEISGKIFSLISTRANSIILCDLQKGIHTEFGGETSTFIEPGSKLYISDSTLIVISPKSSVKEKSIMMRFKLQNLDFIDSLSLSIVSVHDLDKERFSVIYRDQFSNLIAATISKHDLRILHSQKIFDLDNRTVGNIYWSEDGKYLLYFSGKKMYGGHPDEQLAEIATFESPIIDVYPIALEFYTRGSRLYLNIENKYYFVQNYFEKFGAQLWKTDWPKMMHKGIYEPDY